MSFSININNWYSEHKRNLPWRTSKNPYHIWLSEIMLQQTRVAQGLPYFMKFTTRFPTVFDLAKASESEVLKLWQGLGYYSRARNLHQTAKYVSNTLQGVFPNNYKQLLTLKGVGDYTASAIASICFEEPVAVVDGNVYRVLSRYFGIKTPINSTQGIKEFKKLAQEVMDTQSPGEYNQALMDFGALQCKPQNPLCNECLLVDSCEGFRLQLTKELPVKEKKQRIKKRYFNFLVAVTDENETLLEERKGRGIWEGLYQFPLIERNKYIGADELITSKEFISKFTDKVNVTLYNKKEIIHKLSHQHLYTQYWIVNTPKLNEPTLDWTAVKEKPVPVLIAKFLDQYLKTEG